jgi:hypothetical protein
MPDIEIRDTGARGDVTGLANTDDSAVNATPENPLDSMESLQELRQVQEWWCESRDLCTANRAERVLDHDYYDNIQWSNQERQDLYNRGQAPLVYNKLSLTVDWVTGTEKRTRIDYAVHPRNEDGVQDAKNKEKLLKYVSDTNRSGWERSRAFEDAVISGLGWTEQSVRGDSAQEMLVDAYVPWQQMWHDPFLRDLALKDCRYLHRRKWTDLDYAISMFPGREMIIRRASRSHLFTDEDLLDDELDLPQPFRRYDNTGAEVVQRRWTSMFPSDGGTTRLRVPLCETWWRCPKNCKKMWGVDYPGTVFDPKNEQHKADVANGYVSLTDAVVHEIRITIWVPGGVLYRGVSPFKHGQFPFTPVWGKRRSNDGMEYGLVRGVRDAQDDLNHTHSKIKWYASSGQLEYEEDAIDPEMMSEIRRNLAKPNGELKYKSGAISKNKVRIQRHLDKIEVLTKLEEISASHIHDGTGVNREQLGRDTNATAGVAIRAKQEEGGVATAKYFDNNRLGVQLSGEKNLSNCEQFMTLPMQIYIEGEGPKLARGRNQEWLKINQPVQQPDGSWELHNDITKNQARFVVDEQDYKESVRQAQSEQLWDMLSKMPPEIQLAMLDLAVETTDIQNKDEWVRRLRKLNGQPDPDAANDPQAQAEQEQQQQVQQQQAAADKQRTDASTDARTALDAARARELHSKAASTDLASKMKALEVAGAVESAQTLAPAADRLLDGVTQQDSGNAGNQQQPTQ